MTPQTNDRLRIVLLLIIGVFIALGCGSTTGNDEDDDSAENMIPISEAGENQEAFKHMVVFLDGNSSTANDGDLLTYHWSFISKPDNSTATLSDENQAISNFIIDVDGDYLLKLIVNNGEEDSLPDTVTVTASTPSVSFQTSGLNFSPYMNDQDPNLGVQVEEAQLRNRMAVIAPYTKAIRTFGSTNGLEHAGWLAKSMGLKAFIGAWLGRNANANEQEIDNLIDAANEGYVDIAIVGSEVLLRGDLTEQQLTGYIQRVQDAVPDSVLVTTAGICSNLLQHPDLLSAVDVIFFNQYAYWEGTSLGCAVASLHSCYKQLTAAAPGKPVYVSETGWPSCGNTIDHSVPSPENAEKYFLNVVSWAQANDVPIFYFEAFDEPWKAKYEGPQGACWGVWDKDGVLKSGMQRVFDGETMSDNWSELPIPGGSGEPFIDFTFVPEVGSSENLRGQVLHVRPAEYKVAVYIRVAGRWWTKPTFAEPLTSIACNGAWIADITTGGIDPQATDIAAYLVENGYAPPLARGSRTLPAELDTVALANVKVTR